MRILVLNIEYPPVGGGASPICKLMCEMFAERDQHVTVVTSQFGDRPDYEMINGVHIYRVNCLRRQVNMSNPFEHILYLINAQRLIKRLFNSKSFDVCHCHFLIPTGILAYYLKKTWNLPFIVTIHGSDVPGYNPDRFQFIHKFTKGLLLKIIKASSKIVSPSYYLESLLTRHLNVINVGDKIMMIPYPFKVGKTMAVSKENIIMSSGRLLRRKGFHTLIDAVSSFDLGYELHIFGDGPMMEELTQMGKSSMTKVVLHGWVDNSSKLYQDYLAKSSIFVLMSSHENSSVSIMEAMANKCAVVSTDKTGCLEMVNDVGLCLPINDPQNLTLALQHLIKKPEKIKEMSGKSFKKIQTFYSSDVVAESYLGLLKSVVQHE